MSEIIIAAIIVIGIILMYAAIEAESDYRVDRELRNINRYIEYLEADNRSKDTTINLLRQQVNENEQRGTEKGA